MAAIVVALGVLIAKGMPPSVTTLVRNNRTASETFHPQVDRTSVACSLRSGVIRVRTSAVMFSLVAAVIGISLFCSYIDGVYAIPTP